MTEPSLVVAPGPQERTVRTASGEVLQVPDRWALLAPGDAGLTRKVKSGGPTWTVIVKRGRKKLSQGVWAPAEQIESARLEVAATRSTTKYRTRREADSRRRERKQADYVVEFEESILSFLNFHPRHSELARRFARLIAEYATPVGSGTVARTAMIPVSERAEAATIAWLRHHTTAYEHMSIPRVKGRRREVRRQLARESRKLLDRYRAGVEALATCPLRQALDRVLREP